MRPFPKPHHCIIEAKILTNTTNSATAEVSEVFGAYPAILEANVYGVTVPNHEGRAGCTALQLKQGTTDADLKDLARFLRPRLPKDAVPVFLRVVENSTHTDNHTQGKVALREEGVDPVSKARQRMRVELVFRKRGYSTY